MRTEFYSPEELARTRALYDAIRKWGQHRGDVNLIGGWAVHELVEGFAMESSDVDLILHTQAAFDSFNQHLSTWGLAWRHKGRTVYKECHFRGREPIPPIVDVFTTDPSIGARLFTALAGSNARPKMGPDWLPPVEALLRDKILSVPLRATADKAAKDLLDIWALVFHNRVQRLPGELLNVARREERLRAAKRVRESREAYPEFQERFDTVDEWLRRV